MDLALIFLITLRAIPAYGFFGGGCSQGCMCRRYYKSRLHRSKVYEAEFEEYMSMYICGWVQIRTKCGHDFEFGYKNKSNVKVCQNWNHMLANVLTICYAFAAKLKRSWNECGAKLDALWSHIGTNSENKLKKTKSSIIWNCSELGRTCSPCTGDFRVLVVGRWRWAYFHQPQWTVAQRCTGSGSAL